LKKFVIGYLYLEKAIFLGNFKETLLRFAIKIKKIFLRVCNLRDLFLF